jgi:hypothetical protein
VQGASTTFSFWALCSLRIAQRKETLKLRATGVPMGNLGLLFPFRNVQCQDPGFIMVDPIPTPLPMYSWKLPVPAGGAKSGMYHNLLINRLSLDIFWQRVTEKQTFITLAATLSSRSGKKTERTCRCLCPMSMADPSHARSSLSLLMSDVNAPTNPQSTIQLTFRLIGFTLSFLLVSSFYLECSYIYSANS